MSRNVDERIVEMRFENDQFESGVSKTLSSLDKLTEKLKFKGAESGMAALEGKANSFNMDRMGSAAETVTNKFSALEVAGITAIASIAHAATTTAINVGKKLFNKYMIKPISDGFKEYELIQNTIQTIYTNTKDKGTTINDIEQGLDELNEYADKTIYVMSDMTRAIGQFTNAGIDFNTSKAAVVGFANLAAAVGATNEQLSRVEYQSSQAMSAGVFRLLDWNSIQNSPLGGAFFQKALIKNAKEFYSVTNKQKLAHILGYTELTSDAEAEVNNMIESTTEMLNKMEQGAMSFRRSFDQKESMNANWLQSDIFVKTLQEFADDPELLEAATSVRTFTKLRETLEEAAGSGWAQTWKLIVGDFGESKALWTDVSQTLSKIIDGISDARNGIVRFWKEAGGRTSVINGLKYAMEALLRILAPIRDAFNEVLSPYLEKLLMHISIQFQQLTGKMLIGEETANGIKNIFVILFKVAKVFLQISSKIADYFAKAAYWMSKWIGDGIQLFGKWIGDGSKIKSVWDKIVNIFKKKEVKIPKNSIYEFEEEVENAIDKIKLFDKIKGGINKFINGLINIGINIRDFFKNQEIITHEKISGFFMKLVEIGKSIPGAFSNGWNKIKDWWASLKDSPEFKKISDGLKSLGDSLKYAFTTVGNFALDKFNEFMDGLKDPEKKAARAEKLSEVLTSIGNALKIIADFAVSALNGIKNVFDAISEHFNTGEAKEVEETAEAVEDLAEANNELTESEVKGSKVSRGGIVSGTMGFSSKDIDNASNKTKKFMSTWTNYYNKFSEAHDGKTIETNKESVFQKIFSEDNDFFKKMLTGGGIIGTIGLFVAGYIEVLRLIKAARTVSESVVSKIFDPIKNFLENADDMLGLKSFAKIITSKNRIAQFKDVAKGIALLAGSIFLITVAAKDPDALWKAAAIIGGLIVVTSTMVIALGKAKLGSMEGISRTILALGVTVFLIAGIMATLGYLIDNAKNPNSFEYAITTVYVVIAALGALVMAMMHQSHMWTGLDPDMWKVLISTAGAVFIIASAISKLSKQGPANLITATASISAVMGMLYLVLKGLSKLPKVEGSVFISLGSMMKSLALSLVLISVAVGILGNMDPDAIKQGVWIAVALMGMLTIIGGVIGGLSSELNWKFDQLKQMGVGLILFSVAVDLIVPAIAILAAVAHKYKDGNEIGSAFNIIARLFGGMSIVMAICSMLMKESKSVDVILLSTSLVIFAAAVGIFVAAFAGLASVINKYNDIQGVFGKTVGVIIGFVALFAAASLLTMIPQVSAGIIIFSGAFAVFAVGVLILSKATGRFSKAVLDFAVAIKLLASVSKKDLNKIKDNIITFIGNMYEVWVALAASFVAGAHVFVDALNEILPLLEPIIDWVLSKLESKIGNKFGFWGQSLGEKLGNMIIKALQNLILYLNDHSSEIIDLFYAALLLISKFFIEGIDKLANTFDIGIGDFDIGLKNITSPFKAALDLAIRDLTGYDFTEAAESIRTGIDEITSAFDGYSLVTPEIAAPFIDFGPTEEAAEIFGMKLPGKVATKITEESETEMPPAGGAMAEDVSSGIDSSMGGIIYSGNSIIQGLFDTLTSPENLQKLTQAAGIDANTYLNKFNSVAGIKSPSKETAWSASMLIAGLVNTLTAGQYEARITGYRYASAVISGIKDASTESLDYKPSITPVLRANSVTKQLSSMRGLMNANQTMSVATTAKLASQDAVTMRKYQQTWRRY